MELAPILILGGVVVFLGLYLWLRPRTPEPAAAPFAPEMLASDGDGLLVARPHGQLVYVNDVARDWLGREGAADLESFARQVAPSAAFLDLFTREGRASVQVSGRWLEAVSEQQTLGGAPHTVVRLRERRTAQADPDSLDLGRAIGVVNEIGETITAALSVEQVLQALLTIAMKAVPADAGEISLWDDDAQVLVPRGWVGDVAYVLALAEQGGVYRLDDGISGYIARHRQSVLVTDRDDAASVRPSLDSATYQSFVGVPLQMGERFVGTFELAANATGQFRQADLALLQAVARPMATAIYNAELYGEQMRRLDDIAHLQQAAQTPSDGGDARAVFAVLGEQIARLTSADICGVLLYDERKRALVAEAPFYGLPAQVIGSYTVPLPDDSPAHDIFFERDYWLSNDLADEPLVEPLGMATLVHAAGVNNTALLPLQIGAARIGLLQVGNKRTHGGFTTRDIQSLRILASQAAVVVQNVRLYQTEQQVDAELAGLQEMTHAIGALRQEGAFYADINRRIARLMDVEMSGILLYDAANARLVSQPPFYGVDDALAHAYVVPLTPGNALTEIWEDEDSWFSNRVSSDLVFYQAGVAEVLAGMRVNKALFAVLSVGGRRVGLVQAANKRDGGDFNERDARLLLIFATQAAAMIENARLYREAQRRADEADSLRRVAELAGAVNTASDLFAPALAQVAALLDSPVAFVSALSAETGALVSDPRDSHGLKTTAPFVQDVYAEAAQERVTVTRRARLMNDIADSQTPAAYREMAEAFGLTRLLVVPLRVGERALGEIVVANRDTAYTDDDRRTLTALAVQFASALDRVRLQEATGQNLSRRLHELDAISRVSNELNLTLEFDRVLDVIRQEALTASEASGCTIALMATGTTDLNRRVGDPLVSATFAAIEREALRRGVEPVRVDDYADSDLTPLPAQARSAVAAAIVYADQPIGVLHLYHELPGHFDAQAATFAATLAAKASLGYANAQRYQESLDRSARLRRRVEQLNQIFELGQMAQATVTPEMMLEAFAYSIQQSAGWDVVVMLLADPDAGVLRRVAHAGLPVDTFERSRARTIALADVERLLRDDFRISESYLLPFDKIAQWYVSGSEALGGGFEGNRSLYPRGKNDWRDGDMMLVPLHSPGGGLIGLISLDRPFNNRRPDRSDIEVLEIFAHQAATTLENVRLFNQAEAQTERLQLLNRVSLALAQSLDNENILEISLREIAQILQADRARAYVFEGDAKLARLVVDFPRSDEPPSGLIDVADYPALLAVSRTLEPLVIDDVTRAAETDPVIEPLASSGMRAYAVFPVAVSGQAVGLFELERDDDAPLTGAQVDLSAIIANQTAVALQNALLLEQTLVRTREMETLLEAAQATAFTLDLNAVFDNTARLMLRALDMDACAILLYDRDADTLEVGIDLRRNDRSGGLTPGARLAVDAYPARRRSLDNRHVTLAHADDETLDANERTALNANGSATRMLVPLVTRDQSIGLMLVDLRDAGRIVTHRDIRMAQALAATAATAIENARLFVQVQGFADELNQAVQDRTVELQQERDRLESLYQITSELASTLDTDMVLARALEMVAATVHADEGVILLVDPNTRRLYRRAALQDGGSGTLAAEKLGAWMMDNVSAVVIDDLHTLDAWDADDAAVREWRAAVSVLLESGEQPVGAMVFLSRSPGLFADVQLRLVSATANQIISSINNAELFTVIREQAEHMGTLLRAEQDEAEKSSAILESIADGVVLADARGSVVLFNRAAERIFGFSRHEIIGQPFARLARLFGGDNSSQLLAGSDAVTSSDLLVERLELGERIINLRISPVRSAHQQLGTVSVFRDVTRDVEVDRMKSDFISNVSHELRTPMTSIKGYVDLLLMGAGGPVPDAQKRFLDTIKSNADRLTVLLNDLLNISRMDAGTERLNLAAVDVGDVLNGVVANLTAQARFAQKAFTLDVHLAPDLPPVQADRARLVQILTHVLENAFNYTYAGGRITVEAAVRPETRDLLISVADTGVGIPASFRERVWGRFERYEENALVMDVAGTGLGLPIARELVHMHGGDIWFESQVNQGTTFYISLPLADAGALPATTGDAQTTEG